MSYETKDNSGSLFPKRDKKSDRSPDYSGSVRIDGRDYWIDGWRKVSGNGTSWLSLAFKAKDGTAARPRDQEREFKDAVKRNFPDTDIPF